ncbi:MAG TPA: hypothetical protein VFQ88_07395 [Nevskiaceae bacterium]|nr:hypothetical protein [Nevskiaceae bacterium]
MQRTAQSSTKLFMALDIEMDEADRAWRTAAEGAFDRLQIADPELA